MLNISVRQQRFLKMWVKHFAITMVVLLVVLAIAFGFGYALLWIESHYGIKVLSTVLGSLILMGFVATFSGMYTEEKLNKLEKEESSVLNALKQPYEPEDPQELYSKVLIKPYIPKTNNKAYAKYINAIYGKGSTGV